MPVHLTDSAIARGFREATEAKERRELADAKEPGLRIRLTPGNTRTPAGTRNWVLCCRDRLGAMRKFPIGAYGGDGGLSIAEARTEARALRLRVRQDGHDPIAAARRDRALGRDARAGVGTLKAEIDHYGEVRGAKLKSWPHSRKRVDLVFKPLMARPIDTLTARDLQAEANQYPAQQSAAFAVRTIRPVLKWLADRERAPAGLAALKAPAAVVKRQRALSRDELARIIPALRASTTAHAALMQFLLLTMARLNEAGGATWESIDVKAKKWTIPATVAKNGKEHVVPLSRQALTLLQTLKPAKPRPTDLIFATDSGKPLGNWDRAGKKVQADSKTTGWHRHDLRRTSTTLLGRLGIPPYILEAALNHTIESELARNYNLSRYEEDVAAALQRLADELDLIVSEPTNKGSEAGA